jgi:L-lactate dehydrogenase (cytochrome)
VPKLSRQAAVKRAASIDDLRALARRRTPRAAFDYVDGAGETEQSYARSRAAFDRVEFRPQVLRDVSAPNTATSVLGRTCSMPLVLAPTGFTRMLHYQGGFAVAAAAADAAVPYTLSTMGTVACPIRAQTPAQLPSVAATHGQPFLCM